MSTILTATLLSVPIVGGAGYLLRQYPRETIIVATEIMMYATPVIAYAAVTMRLVPVTEPIWLQLLAMLSCTAVTLGLAPTFVRRTTQRLIAALIAARNAEPSKDGPA